MMSPIGETPHLPEPSQIVPEKFLGKWIISDHRDIHGPSGDAKLEMWRIQPKTIKLDTFFKSLKLDTNNGHKKSHKPLWFMALEVGNTGLEPVTSTV